VENEIVYACFDAGGIRILDCRNKSVIRETGRFANEALYKPFNLPRAYNNLEKEGDLLYVAVDYCGVEILDISDTSQITLKGWWNPYNCPNNNWFTSPVHANELSYNQECHRLFVSTGKSDVYVLDVSDPENPDSCDNYGGVDNSIGTWGVSVHETQMFLSYICTLGVPFASNSSGVKILGFDHCTANIPTPFELVKPAIYPNPSTGLIHVKGVNEESRIRVFNTSMQPVFTGESEEDLSGFKFQEGFYYIVVHSASEYYVLKFVVVP
jgi:hypothetical protein